MLLAVCEGEIETMKCSLCTGFNVLAVYKEHYSSQMSISLKMFLYRKYCLFCCFIDSVSYVSFLKGIV